ncbi:MAG: hypothetical protein R6U70_00965 [Bacillota bacterium]
MRYLESSYDRRRNGWYAVCRAVNSHPHAPWWHFDDEKGMIVIDQNWGNPTAELTGYLYRYRSHVRELDLGAILKCAVDHINL